MKITVFGDSILKGVITGEGIPLFDVVKDNSLALAQRQLGFELDNQSVFGNTINKAQRKLIQYLKKGETCDFCIIESGGNDCDYDWNFINDSELQSFEPRVPLTEFLRILDEMVIFCRENKITPILMSMPPLVWDNWYEHICKQRNKNKILSFLNGNPNILYQNHEKYNLHLVKYAFEKNVQLVDMRMHFLEHPDYRTIMCADGIHPSKEGYEYMSKLWIKKIPELRKE